MIRNGLTNVHMYTYHSKQKDHGKSRHDRQLKKPRKRFGTYRFATIIIKIWNSPLGYLFDTFRCHPRIKSILCAPTQSICLLYLDGLWQFLSLEAITEDCNTWKRTHIVAYRNRTTQLWFELTIKIMINATLEYPKSHILTNKLINSVFISIITI